MKWIFRTILLTLIFAASWEISDTPANRRLDFWVEPRANGIGYTSCRREGSFDPMLQYALFTFPGMVRDRLHVAPLPCTGKNVRFIVLGGPKQQEIVNRAEKKDGAALFLTVVLAVCLVRFSSLVWRVLICRNR